MTDRPTPPRARNALNAEPFDLAHLREECLEALRQSPNDLEDLVPAQQAVLAAFRVMPLLAEILADGINQRYAAYQEKGSVGSRADMDLLMALHGSEEAYGLTLTFDVRSPEGLALFEHPDFDPEIDAMPKPLQTQIRAHQQQWREERKARHAVLRVGPPTT